MRTAPSSHKLSSYLGGETSRRHQERLFARLSTKLDYLLCVSTLARSAFRPSHCAWRGGREDERGKAFLYIQIVPSFFDLFFRSHEWSQKVFRRCFLDACESNLLADSFDKDLTVYLKDIQNQFKNNGCLCSATGTARN